MNEPMPATSTPSPQLVQYTHWIYGLHALSVALGIFTAASIVGMFVFGWPSIIAVIMNYVRRSETAGTWLESHFRWQIRTFWFALLWGAVTSIISAPLVLALGLGIITWMIGFLAVGIWVVYRVARGWLALRDGQPVPRSAATL
jgi:uncharacterized membrane protein